MPSLLIFVVYIVCHYVFCISAARLADFEMMEVKLGKDLGFEPGQREVNDDTLKAVLDGVKVGNVNSMYFYGLFKLYGISLPKDEKSAAEMFKKAADLEHVESTTAYGMMLMHGLGVAVDGKKAAYYFRKGVKMGDMNAHWLLGKVLVEDPRAQPPPGIEEIVEEVPIPKAAMALHNEAFELFTKAAAAGLREGQHYLALMYEYGWGCKQDFDRAIEHYRRASGQNYWESTYHLALMYAYGRPKQDFRKALPLLERAARAEHAPSIYYIGVFKMYGYGCMPDYERALNWFERAAGLDDYRISEKAAKAAVELRNLIQGAEEKNNAVLEEFAQRAEEY
jgi:TPR repeat protein